MNGWNCFPSLTRGRATRCTPHLPVLRKIFKTKELMVDLDL